MALTAPELDPDDVIHGGVGREQRLAAQEA